VQIVDEKYIFVFVGDVLQYQVRTFRLIYINYIKFLVFDPDFQRDWFFADFALELFVEILGSFISDFGVKIETDPALKTFQMDILATAFTFAETDQLVILVLSIVVNSFVIEIETNSTLSFFRVELLNIKVIEIFDF